MEEPCSPTVSLYLGLCTRLVVGGDILDGCSKEMGEAGSELIASGPSSKVLIFVFVGSLRDPTSFLTCFQGLVRGTWHTLSDPKCIRVYWRGCQDESPSFLPTESLTVFWAFAASTILSPFYVLGVTRGSSTPLQCSCLENPRDGGASWAAIYRVSQSRTRLKQLSSSSSSRGSSRGRGEGIKKCMLMDPWDSGPAWSNKDPEQTWGLGWWEGQSGLLDLSH